MLLSRCKFHHLHVLADTSWLVEAGTVSDSSHDVHFGLESNLL